MIRHKINKKQIANSADGQNSSPNYCSIINWFFSASACTAVLTSSLLYCNSRSEWYVLYVYVCASTAFSLSYGVSFSLSVRSAHLCYLFSLRYKHTHSNTRILMGGCFSYFQCGNSGTHFKLKCQNQIR